MGKRQKMVNGDIYDDPPPQRPLVLLDCTACPGYQHFELESATRAKCKACGTVQENERVVDLNEERL